MSDVLKKYPTASNRPSIHEMITKYKKTFQNKRTLTKELIEKQNDIVESLKDGKYQAIEQDGLRFSADMPVMVFDIAVFAAEQPHMYARYLKQSKQSLLIEKI